MAIRRPQLLPSIARRQGLAMVMASLIIAGGTMTACSSTNSTASVNPSGSHRAPIPASAFKSTTGLTASTVTIGNVSTESLGLFTGSVVGTEAYAAYVNSLGGVNGRRLTVDAQDDGFTGSKNKQLTQSAVQSDFALVGSFSLEDSFGATVVAENPDVPDVSSTLDPYLTSLPNAYSADPTPTKGWQTGPLDFYKRKYPTESLHTGVLASTYPSAVAVWNKEKVVAQHAGYKIVYYDTVPTTQQNFNQNIVSMEHSGVQLIFIDQLPENYVGGIFQALNQQNFHPKVIIGTAAYSEALVPAAGGPANVDGTDLEMPNALFLGEDASGIPAVGTFLRWVQKVSPGFKPDYYTLAGWANTQLFVQALSAAGKSPTQGSVQQQLRKITSFDASHLLAPTNPADGQTATCYLVAKVVAGHFVRSDDPPVNGPTHGYRCDGGFMIVGG
jgi:ABC-type branched-subunit amino acid transport system substrate-binding protein